MAECFNPFALLKAAAGGSLDAQRALVDASFAQAMDGDLQAALDGLCFARLAAAHGDVRDAGRLLMLLSIASDMLDEPRDSELRASVRGEAIALVARLADQGNADAEAELLTLVQESTPADVEASKYLSGLMAAA